MLVTMNIISEGLLMNLETMSIKEIWEHVEQVLRTDQGPYKHLNAVYELHLDEDVYQLHFTNGELSFYEAIMADAHCTLRMSEKNFKKFLQGDLNHAMAFMTGQLKVDGNISLALSLEKVLKKYKLF